MASLDDPRPRLRPKRFAIFAPVCLQERRGGELLHEREMAKGGGDERSDHRSQAATGKTLSDLGISKTQSSRWQKLAATLAPEFEAALAGDARPTTAGSEEP